MLYYCSFFNVNILTWCLGPSRRIPANVGADMLAGIIMSDIPELGVVVVSRRFICVCISDSANLDRSMLMFFFC